MAKASKKGNNKPSVSRPGRLPLTIVIDTAILTRIERYKKDKGLRFPQDVCRLAVAYFLEKNDY